MILNQYQIYVKTVHLYILEDDEWQVFNVIKQYEKIFEWFDSHRNRDLIEKDWLDLTISHLKPSAKILDVGCGMGQPIAQYFLDKGYDLTGIDGSEKLVALAKQRLQNGNYFCC